MSLFKEFLNKLNEDEGNDEMDYVADNDSEEEDETNNEAVS